MLTYPVHLLLSFDLCYYFCRQVLIDPLCYDLFCTVYALVLQVVF